MKLDVLSRATGMPPSRVPLWAAPLTAAMAQFEINTPQRQAHFLAQVGHESAGFSRLVENLNYSAEALRRTWPTRFTPAESKRFARDPEGIANRVYGGRLGNTQPGDGWKFRGRGLIQITGRANYAACGKYMFGDERSLLIQPELLEELDVAASSAGWFWMTHGLNELADAGNVAAVTRRINGGANGLEDRKARYARAAKALGL